ncbi:hypothetical protein Tcan_09865 [Toxocara canis]|uniref:Uncharacterized protein n=1 Tax=Toxocara canis TaxID=6265 RepID=A0A0B2VHA0_TOXCA|nr:hypothetical protein Tcan_09865 [Toxocara canis]
MLVMTSSHCYNDTDEDAFGDDRIPLRNTPVGFSENYAFCFNADSPANNGGNEKVAEICEAASTSGERIGTSSTHEVGGYSKVIAPESVRPILRTELSQPLLQGDSGGAFLPLNETTQPLLPNQLYHVASVSGHSLSTIESGHAFKPDEHEHAFRPTHSILTSRLSQPPQIIDPPHSILMPRESGRSSTVDDSVHPPLISRPSRTVVLADPIELTSDTSSRAPVFFTNTPIKAPRVRSLIDRQLRKFASETSFATTLETTSDSSEQELAGGRGRVFTVRPVPNNSSNRFNGGGTVFGRLIRRRQESDGSGSLGSEATVASASMTPLSRQKMRSRMRRPKSATHMGQGYEVGNYGSSGASATLHSLHSLDSMQPLTVPKDDRRPSNVYMMDDDSVHEFEEDNVPS